MKCIRSTFEYQVLDGIRLKLGLHEKNIEAPVFEIAPDTNLYVRYCRLKVRQIGLAGDHLPRPLFAGMLLSDAQTIEFYMTNCLDKETLERDSTHNWVFASLCLADPKSLTVKMLKKTISLALAKAHGDRIDSPSLAACGSSWMHGDPLIKRSAIEITTGPYYWSTRGKRTPKD